jgi:hypothetical protein
MGSNEEIIVAKLKGLHKAQADLLKYHDFVKLFSEKHVFNFSGLLKVKTRGEANYKDTSTYYFDIINNIIEQDIKKTLKIDVYDSMEEVMCMNEDIYLKNKDNIEKTQCFIIDNKRYNNFLVFLFR